MVQKRALVVDVDGDRVCQYLKENPSTQPTSKSATTRPSSGTCGRGF